MYEVGGCLIDLREGEREASTRKLEIEPPGLEFACAIANSARSRLRRVLGAVDKMDGILGVPVQIHGEGVSWGSKMLKIERRGSISCALLETAVDNRGYL
jgi:hypothetical protein